MTRKIWVKSAGKCLFHDTQTFLRSQWIVYIPQCCGGVAVTKAGTNLIKRKTSCVQATCISLSQLVAALYICNYEVKGAYSIFTGTLEENGILNQE